MSPPTDFEPFGNPEGARADITQIRDEFVEFSPAFGSAGLALPEDDLTARVIVGKKGSGKTVYLRRAQAFATDSPDVYADDSSQQPPLTAQIIKIAEIHQHVPNTYDLILETWSGVWKAAIMRSLVSHLRHADHLSTPDTIGTAEDVWRDYPHLCPPELDQLSVYSQVQAIINDFEGGAELERYIGHQHWDAVERRVGNALQHCRPVCFYLDAIDEEYRHSPRNWLACQTGLFFRVMQFLRDKRFGSRLHILICIRDHVYASVFQSEHLTRYLSRQHIRRLDWTWASMEHLLLRKIERLGDEHLMKPGAAERGVGRPVEPHRARR